MATTTLTVDQWINVRTAVASAMQTQEPFPKAQEVAERLMAIGYIDAEAVLASIEPEIEPEEDDVEPEDEAQE